MIDIGKILKRAWHILWNYKVLWLFGLILVFTTGGGSSPNSNYRFGSTSGQRFETSADQWMGPSFDDPFRHGLNQWFNENVTPLYQHPEQYISTFIWIAVGILVFILITATLAAILRYVSETALIRMVDEYEQTGTKASFKQGWRYGWSRTSWRLFLINLIINLPAIIFVPLILAMILVPVISGIAGGFNEGGLIVSMVFGMGFAFILIFLVSIIMAFLRLLRQFFWRACALESVGVGESFRQGFYMFKQNWQSVLLTWLVMFGLGIAYVIAITILFFLLIPVYVFTSMAGLIVAAIPGLIAYGIASLFTIMPVAVIIGIVVGLPFLLTIIFSPLIFMSGLVNVFVSSVWTLTYREIKLLHNGNEQVVKVNKKEKRVKPSKK